MSTEVDTKEKVVPMNASDNIESVTSVSNQTLEPEQVVAKSTENPATEGTDIDNPDDRKVSVVDTLPPVEFLTIKNLDTGEAFVIGQNDPDFDFHTFALGEGWYSCCLQVLLCVCG